MKRLFFCVCMVVWTYSGSVLAQNEETAMGSSIRPVKYVKVCSLYGAGFHYVPGTDLCLEEATGITKKETLGGTLTSQTELAQRVAQLEERVAELEAKLVLINKHLAAENREDC